MRARCDEAHRCPDGAREREGLSVTVIPIVTTGLGCPWACLSLEDFHSVCCLLAPAVCIPEGHQLGEEELPPPQGAFAE